MVPRDIMGFGSSELAGIISFSIYRKRLLNIALQIFIGSLKPKN